MSLRNSLCSAALCGFAVAAGLSTLGLAGCSRQDEKASSKPSPNDIVKNPEPAEGSGQDKKVSPDDAVKVSEPGKGALPDKKALPKPLPEEVVRTWEDAGADFGWMRLDRNQFGIRIAFTPGKQGAPGEPTTDGASTERLSVHHVGEYGGVPWVAPGTRIEPGSREDRVRNLNLSVASINLNKGITPAEARSWAQTAQQGHAQGKVFLPHVYFWDGNDRFEGSLRDIEVYWQRIDTLLAEFDPEHIHGIVLAEENVPGRGRAEILTELYHRIKKKYDIPVWQWWSPATLVPGGGGWIPADGWVVDPYFKPKEPFRRYVRKYLITGEPLVIMPAATDTTFSGKPGPMTPAQWQASNDQLDIAVEFNLPVAFYWVAKPGSVHFGGSRRANPDTEIARINRWVWNYTRRVRTIPANYNGRPSADRAIGRILELAPNRQGQLDYSDTFSISKCVDDAAMTGFRNLVLENGTLIARGFQGRPVNTSLTYHFAGNFSAQHPRVMLNATTNPSLNGRVELALSTNGKTWHYQATSTQGQESKQLTTASRGDQRFASLDEFWVRIRLAGGPGSEDNPPVQIDNLRIGADIAVPEDRAVTLKPVPNNPRQLAYEDTFETQKYIHTTSMQNEDHLEWSTGQIAVRMRPGGSTPTLGWKVTANQPVKNIRIAVDGRANPASLATNHYLDVSLDGENWRHTTSTANMETNNSGWTSQRLNINLANDPDFNGVKTFYVRLRMNAGSYKEAHPYYSGIVTRFRVNAITAQPNR